MEITSKMNYEDEFTNTRFLPNRTITWNITISADSTEGALNALGELTKAIQKRRVSVQKIEADYWFELDKLKDPSPEWIKHLHVQSEMG